MKLFLLLILLPLIWLIISPTVKVSADEVVKGVTIVKPSNTKSDVAKKNINTIIEYFSLYLGDLDKFYSLWVPDEPIVITPLVGEDVAVASVKDHIGWEAVKAFYDPIFQNMKGKFNWTINEFIVSEDPNLIITKSHSDIDVTTSGIFGDKKLKYKGVYVQIFTFENGKVKSFEEYFDTALLNSQYGS